LALTSAKFLTEKVKWAIRGRLPAARRSSREAEDDVLRLLPGEREAPVEAAEAGVRQGGADADVK
jgi:hypothetical protein